MIKYKIFLINFILLALGGLIIISNKQIEAASLNLPTWDEDPMVLTQQQNPLSGLLPRGGGVDMTLPASRNNKNTTQWTASTSDSSTYFCAGYGMMLRFGRYDTTLYFYNVTGKNEDGVGKGRSCNIWRCLRIYLSGALD